MAQDTTPAIIVYRGNGDNSVPYDVPFDKGYYGEIKVAFIRRGLDDYTYEPDPSNYTVNGRLYAWFSGTVYVYTHTPTPAVGAPTYNASDVEQPDTVSAIAGQTITVNAVVYSRAVQHDIANQLLLTWTGTVLTSDDFICIVRDTERGQPYVLPNNQKHIEYALDNLERQIQENKGKLDNALLVDPSHTIDSSKMDPLDWLKSIVRSVDFSARALRVANGWIDYSSDDPNMADADKTWTHLLNTDNIKSIREEVVVDPVTLEESRNVYYTDQNGVEHLLNVSEATIDIWLANAIDQVTIIQNENSKLEAQAIKNRNAAGDTPVVYDWVGTMAEYITQDVAAQHPEWLCYITDDMYDPSSTYTFEQGESASTWYVTHNLNKYPSVTVVDSAGTTVDCTVIYINSNECELRFNAAFKGRAYLN